MAKAKSEISLIDVLNDLRSRELAVVMQYMRQHYVVTGPEGMLLADTFKDVAITEMKHAEALAERIDFLGGNPTTKPEKFDSDFSNLREMAKSDYNAEEDAIMRYRAAIKVAAAADDVTTRKLLEDILGDEEDHIKTFSDMLGQDVMGGELLDAKLQK